MAFAPGAALARFDLTLTELQRFKNCGKLFCNKSEPFFRRMQFMAHMVVWSTASSVLRRFTCLTGLKSGSFKASNCISFMRSIRTVMTVRLGSSSLSDLWNVGCESTAAVHFSPSF